MDVRVGLIKKAEHQRTDGFELWCWRRLLRIPWRARRSNQSILKEISSEYPLEGLMWKLKLQYFGHLITKNSLIWKDPDAGEDWRREEKGMLEDEVVGWHHQHNGYEFEQAPGVSDGQGMLACCSPWGCKESTRMSDWTEPILFLIPFTHHRNFLYFSNYACSVNFVSNIFSAQG